MPLFFPLLGFPEASVQCLPPVALHPSRIPSNRLSFFLRRLCLVLSLLILCLSLHILWSPSPSGDLSCTWLQHVFPVCPTLLNCFTPNTQSLSVVTYLTLACLRKLSSFARVPVLKLVIMLVLDGLLLISPHSFSPVLSLETFLTSGCLLYVKDFYPSPSPAFSLEVDYLSSVRPHLDIGDLQSP